MPTEYPLLTLEGRRRHHRYKRVSWRTTVWLWGGAGLVLAFAVIFLQDSSSGSEEHFGQLMLILFNLFGQLLALVWAPTAAAATVARERETGTLDLLLLTPLPTTKIIGEKWVLALQAMLPMTAFLIPFYVFALLLMPADGQVGLIPAAVDLAATVVFYLCVGLFASTITKTTQSARFIGLGLAVATTALVLYITITCYLLHPAYLQSEPRHPFLDISAVKTVVYLGLSALCYFAAVGRLARARNHA